MHISRFSLSASAPFRLDLTVWALRRRNRNVVDCWDDFCYTRVFVIENSPVKVEVRQKTKQPKIFVTAYTHQPVHKLKSKITDILNLMLGLKIDLSWFYEEAKQNKLLKPLVLKFEGMKPPRLPTLFETLVNAIAFQQLSLESGFSLLNKLTHKFGTPFKMNNNINYAFPEPCIILKCTAEDLMNLGFSRHKSESLLAVALNILNDKTFCNLDTLSNEDIIKILCNVKGIGRWSAEYALLRGFGKTEILPGNDVAVNKSIENLLKLRKKPDFNKIKKIEKEWSPFAGLIYFHFLLDKLSKQGAIK